jgi:rhamnose transport system ATP-binding protein
MIREGLAYVPEDRLRQGLCRDLAVRANVVLASLRRLATWGWLPRQREVRLARGTSEALAVRLHSIEQAAGTLSGGNQQKVVLGRWLHRDPRVLILDEPTRGVDVGAKAEIHALVRRLAAEGRAVVLISSDLPEVVAQSDRVGVFREGRLVKVLDPRTSSAEEVAAAAVPAGTGKAGGPEAVGPGPITGGCCGTVSRPCHPPRRSPARPPRVAAGSLREASLLVIVLVFFALLHGRTGHFLGADNVRNLATDAALLSFCGVGAALVILAGGLDISLGALMALSAGVAGRLWEQGHPPAVVAAAAAGVGAAGGLLNAALALLGRVHPIVVTLGTMSVYRGLALWWLGEEDVQIPGQVRDWMFARVLGLPLVVWWGLGLLVLAWVFLRRTVWGREVYALGSNPAAAHRVSIERRRVWPRVFAVQGALAGLAGLLYLAQSGNLQANAYEDKTLEAIAAAVVGGVAIVGGRGSVWGVALGCLFLVSLGPACVALHISPHWQQTLVGSVMVVAVLLDALWRRRGEGA